MIPELAPSFLPQPLRYPSKYIWQSPLNLKHFSRSLQNIAFPVVIYKPAARKMAVVFTEVPVQLTWCYLNSSALLKNEKPSHLKPQIIGGSEAQLYVYCTASLRLGVPQMMNSEQKYRLSGLLAPERGVQWAQCMLLCSCACCKVCHILCYALGVCFQLRYRFLPFFQNLGLIKWRC